MKKLNRFLTKSFKQWHFDENEGCFILWIAFASFIILFAGQFLLHDVALWFSMLCLGVTFIPPVIEAVRCISKKVKFNPLWWFHAIRGVVYGGIIACIVLFVIKGIMFIVSTIC